MSDEKLAIDAVNIRRAPGFPTGGPEVEDLAPGVNIIHGPNACGKTTLARSIQSMLWPEVTDDRMSVIGRFSIENADWRVDLASQRARYQKNGAETSGPNLPSREQRHRYDLSLHDLLQDDTRNESFAQRIQQESIGGYDLDAAYDELGFDDSPSTRRIAEHSKAEAARATWQEATRKARELEQEEQRLPELEAALADAKAAQERVDLYERAIDFRGAQEEYAEATAKLDGFPEILSELSGGEADEVRDLGERIDTEREELETARETLDEATAALEEVGLPEAGVPDGFLAEMKSRRDSLEALESRVDQLAGELEKAKKRRDTARGDIPVDVDHSTLETLEPAVWREIEEFAEAAEAYHQQRVTAEAVEEWLGSSPEQSEATDLQRGRQALEGWLAAGSPTERSLERRTLYAAASSAFLVAASSVALGLLVHPAFLGGIGVAVGLFWYGYRGGRPADGNKNEETREAHRARFERLDLDDPDEWTVAAVRARLTELYDDVADHRLARQREERLNALQPKLADLEEQATALTDRRETLIQDYGLAPDVGDIQLVVLTKRVLDWQTANDDVRTREAEIAKLEEFIDERIESISTALEEYGYDPVTDHAEVTGCIRDLEDRINKHETALAKRERAEQTIQTTEAELEALLTERRDLYESVGLDDGELQRLEDLCSQVADYRAVQREVDQQAALRSDKREKLKHHPKFEPDLLNRSITELRADEREAEATAEKRDELQREIAEIKKDLREARQEYNTEAAFEERQRAMDALEDRLEADAAAMVGDALVDHLKTTTNGGGRPEVFERAHEILVRITRGRYELELEDGAFRVYDTVQQRGFGLGELSSGSRVQLLVAVRIAFVETQEAGLKLPLILDETLANTDDLRARALMNAVIELARHGRQIFYFTAQSDEVAKWNQALDSTEGVQSRTIDLAAHHGQGESLEVPELESFGGRAGDLPTPAEHDHESYGDAIDVPPFSPRQGAGSAHLWYLVNDVDRLHHLLRLGIETWGQLRTLLNGPTGGEIIEDHDARERVLLAGEALDEFVKSWEVGRGERVDRQALEDADAVSENFIDEVHELAEKVDGEGKRIVTRLRAGEVDRFRRSKMDELEAYFREHGYIQVRDTLDPQTIIVRTVNTVERAGLSESEAFDLVESLFSRLATHENTTVDVP